MIMVRIDLMALWLNEERAQRRGNRRGNGKDYDPQGKGGKGKGYEPQGEGGKGKGYEPQGKWGKRKMPGATRERGRGPHARANRGLLKRCSAARAWLSMEVVT